MLNSFSKVEIRLWGGQSMADSVFLSWYVFTILAAQYLALKCQSMSSVVIRSLTPWAKNAPCFLLTSSIYIHILTRIWTRIFKFGFISPLDLLPLIFCVIWQILGFLFWFPQWAVQGLPDVPDASLCPVSDTAHHTEISLGFGKELFGIIQGITPFLLT